MEEAEENSNYEEEKVLTIEENRAQKIERKKYLQMSGKSLWMKSKATKNKTMSIGVSTKSTETPFFQQEYQKPSVIYKNIIKFVV